MFQTDLLSLCATRVQADARRCTADERKLHAKRATKPEHDRDREQVEVQVEGIQVQAQPDGE